MYNQESGTAFIPFFKTRTAKPIFAIYMYTVWTKMHHKVSTLLVCDIRTLKVHMGQIQKSQ